MKFNTEVTVNKEDIKREYVRLMKSVGKSYDFNAYAACMQFIADRYKEIWGEDINTELKGKS